MAQIRDIPGNPGRVATLVVNANPARPGMGLVHHVMCLSAAIHQLKRVTLAMPSCPGWLFAFHKGLLFVALFSSVVCVPL